MRIRWPALKRPWLTAATSFLLTWVEKGGPAVQEPSRRSFGSRLIEQAFVAQLQATARLRFDPNGVMYELHVPLAARSRTANSRFRFRHLASVAAASLSKRLASAMAEHCGKCNRRKVVAYRVEPETAWDHGRAEPLARSLRLVF